jgi:FkbM family methyltransferase
MSPEPQAEREKQERSREKAERMRQKAERRRAKAERAARKLGASSDQADTGGEDLTEPEARFDFFDRAREVTPILAVETKSGTFLVRTDDSNVGRSLFGKRDRGEFRVLRRGLAVLEEAGQAERARAGTFLDVGANIGTTTIAALHANGFPRAVALEPEPRNQRLLRLNVALNGFWERVQIHAAGVSDASGQARLVVMEQKSGTHEVAVPKTEEKGEEKGRRLVDIELVTLDSVVESSALEADGTGLLWIDTEGHEGQVLGGATRLLSEGVSVILEISPRKLEKQGGKDLLLDAANEHYTHFVDMRHIRGDGGGSELRPMDDLRGVIDELSESGASHTEALFVRQG